MFPTAQGYYERIAEAWLPAVSVPCSHLMAPHDRYAVLYHQWLYVDRKGAPHVAGEGFPLDGLTIPRILWRVAGHPWGRHLAAGVIHDSDCAIALSFPPGDHRDRLRLHADELFHEGLEYLGASAATASIWYASVRVGSLASAIRRKPAEPDYRFDLEGYYARLGIGREVLEAVNDGRLRHG